MFEADITGGSRVGRALWPWPDVKLHNRPQRCSYHPIKTMLETGTISIREHSTSKGSSHPGKIHNPMALSATQGASCCVNACQVSPSPR